MPTIPTETVVKFLVGSLAILTAAARYVYPQQALDMRITVSVGSKEYRILWSLNSLCRRCCRAIVLLWLAIASDPLTADDQAAADRTSNQPSGGVTIRLELQPSAPESQMAESNVKGPNVKGPAATSPVLTSPVLTSPAGKNPTAAAQVKPKAMLLAPEKSPAPSIATSPLAIEKSDKTSPAALLSNSRSSRDLGGSNDEPAPETIDRDFSNERTESEQNSPREVQLKADDVPLEQEEHPYDAPAAKSNLDSLEPYREAPVTDHAELEINQFSQRELNIKVGIQNCLNYYLNHPENTTRRGPWALMHALLPLGVESEVMAGSRRVNTIGWLCFNGSSGKQNMFQPTRTGFRPNVGPGVQGHEGQFLAMLAQSRVPADYPLQINRRKYSVMDLAHYEMATCREKSELTFKLIGLSYYLEPNQQWRDNRGQIWSLEKMVAEELAQPINGAACGGVHRLMGLSYSLIERQAAGEPITGHWERSKIYVNDYVNYTMSLQNPDGSFSTNWLESRGMDPKVERKVQTTGHILEWLVYTLPDDHLRSPRVLAAMEYLLNTVGRDPQKDWPIGPRGHALRAMSLYSQRVFGAQVGQLKSYVAEATTASSLR